MDVKRVHFRIFLTCSSSYDSNVQSANTTECCNLANNERTNKHSYYRILCSMLIKSNFIVRTNHRTWFAGLLSPTAFYHWAVTLTWHTRCRKRFGHTLVRFVRKKNLKVQKSILKIRRLSKKEFLYCMLGGQDCETCPESEELLPYPECQADPQAVTSPSSVTSADPQEVTSPSSVTSADPQEVTSPSSVTSPTS